MVNSPRNLLTKPMVEETATPTSFNGTGHSFTNEGGDDQKFSGTNINSGDPSSDANKSHNDVTVDYEKGGNGNGNVNLKCCSCCSIM